MSCNRNKKVLYFTKHKLVLLVYILGIAVTRITENSGGPPDDLFSSSKIGDYSFIRQPFTFDSNNAMLRCSTGLGPAGDRLNPTLGGWYFNGTQIFYGSNCVNNEVIEARGAPVVRFPGVINLYPCGTFTTTEEGVYECRMMNSSMLNQTMRVGVYFSGRSESLDMYPITSLLTIFHLSTQLLQ